MRYSGNLCDGCNEPLLDNEDIVVCPECGTPQHRHCYDKNNCCVNALFHSESFSWQGIVSEKTASESSTLVNEETKGEIVICPNCKTSNPKGTEVCRHCGMKFTMFGINVVETISEQKNADNVQNESIADVPEYKPPCTVGEGEGFDNMPAISTEVQGEEEPAPKYEEQADNSEYFSDDANIFNGPYPADDYTMGIKTNTLGSFIRNNAQSYIYKFKASDVKGRTGFNWAAFFFCPYWFFYRKLYKPGIIVMTLQMCISLIATPALEELLTIYENMATMDMTTMTDEAFEVIFAQLESAMTPVFIMMGFIFVLHIISGFIANGLYKKYIVKNIEHSKSLPSVRAKIAHFAKNGGASMIAVLIAYCAETALSYLASYLMY